RGLRTSASASGSVIPAGTEISVRTNEEIQSVRPTTNGTFSAVVERDVTGDRSEVVIPRGSSAQLIVRQISSGGSTGTPELALDLQSVTVNGVTYNVSTEDLQ